MHPKASPPIKEIPINIVGGNVFGREPFISPEQTFNMYISDGALINTAGYKKVIDLRGRITGRAIYTSSRGDFMIAVVDNTVFKISGPKEFLAIETLFTINTFFGDVFISENLGGQIAICDQHQLWIYNYVTNEIPSSPVTLPLNESGNPVKPGYVTYHDGYFIIPDVSGTGNQWYLSQVNDGTVWNWSPGDPSGPVAGSLQTKPDSPVAVLRAPGKGNLIYVFGRNVVEMWYNNGSQLFPYQRSNSVSIDYGCLSPNTIATMDNFIAWLGVNEKSGPVIMVSEGSGFQRLSTDGIDFKLADIEHPEQSYAFFFKQDGHVFYQITFYNNSDNVTLLYDFNTQTFFYMTDENMNHHITEAVAFFNNTYYFVSINDGSIYELNSDFFSYDYSNPDNPSPGSDKEIPRVRICKNNRRADYQNFVSNGLALIVDQGNDQEYKGSDLYYIAGEDGFVISAETQETFVGEFISGEKVVNDYVPRIDMAISKDGGQTFGNFVSKDLNPLGKRRNRTLFWRLGQNNHFVAQFRIWSRSQVALMDGVMQVRTVE